MERSGVLTKAQFAYRKGLVACEAFCEYIPYTAKCIGEWAGV